MKKAAMSEERQKHLDLNVYQIYPRSFCDSNKDGIGDLAGITKKLDYLLELGVNAIWLCPCFKSPNEDNGYDVADYHDIMDEFGTMEDMKQLISEVHKRDMKIILDLVPNHTSSEHKWFCESRKSKDNPYSDYYYWFDEPQNDWESSFGGSAWQYDDMRGQYYLHSYAVGQPDLNWDNPKVVKEFQDIIDFWIDMGADGFRIDVIDQISKDWENNENCFGPNLHKYINALFGREKTKDIFTVGECWADTPEEIIKHSAEDRGELVTLFQFEHFNGGRKRKFIPYPERRLKYVRDNVAKWQVFSNENNLVHSLLTDNHDNNYLISRVANDGELRYEAATMMAAMVYLLKGTTFIYQGQEIGAGGSHFDSIEDFRDVESVNYHKIWTDEGELTHDEIMDKINFGSRDNPRHPFAWNGDKYCGFSEAEPWMKPTSRYREINLENDLKSEKSVFKFYQSILKLRNESKTIRRGDVKILSTEDDNFFVYERLGDGEKYVVICNFDTENAIDIPEGEIILTNYNRTSSDKSQFKLYETAVYKIKK